MINKHNSMGSINRSTMINLVCIFVIATIMALVGTAECTKAPDGSVICGKARAVK